MISTRNAFCKLLLAMLIACAPVAFSAFDPVGDDTDIFLANPNVTSERPNVLIVLDNTANWNTPFVNEKSALVQVVNGLTNQFNVGLMMMVETGTGNDNVDGAYVRYHVRQMTDANKAALSNMVNNLHILNDKGNNNTVGYALHEAYLYYAGLASRASYGKVKTDTDGTTDPLLQPLAGQHALPANPTASSLYRSPIVDGCQKNFIIYISNGPANENASARAEVEGFLQTLTGTAPPNTITINPNGQQGNWGDEMARYLANADVHSSAGPQNVYTYVVEVNPGTVGGGPDMTALLKSVASNGKGKYFGVTDNASGAGIVDALNAIFNEIQAVNSVFAAVSLPVSVNVRGTNLNQLYLGVFRPDGTKSPRWMGNLKMYSLARDSSGNIYLADASAGLPPAVGIAALNPGTGLTVPSAQSYWTTSSNYWGFRDASLNGPSGPSDSADGEIVEKGGAAQQIRIAYALAEAASTPRKLYTCTQGAFANCIAGSSLSATPFADNNTDITAAAFNFSSRLVSPLSGFSTKAVTNLIDRKPATLTNAAAPLAVSTLSNGATSRTITDLRTSVPQAVTTLTATQLSGTQTVNITSVAKSGSNYLVTAAATLTSGFAAGTVVTFACTAGSGYTNVNGATAAQRTINTGSVTTTTFLIPGPAGNHTCTAGTMSVPGPVATTTATATVTAHGFTSGQSVTIAGASPTQFNGTFGITVLTANTFTYSISLAANDATGTITASGNTTTATATSTAHGLLAGTSVTISGANPSQYNGSFTILTTGANTFTYTVPAALSANTASPVYAVQGGSTTVTVTTAVAHGFVNGQLVTIAGSDIPGYNGTFAISNVGATTFEYTAGSVLPANSSATVTASVGTLPTVTATVANHGFTAGVTNVIIESTSGDAVHPGTYPVASVIDANTFTYSTVAALAAPSGSYTARPSTHTATATITAHGYAGPTQEIVVAGATPNGYNGTFTATVIDANTVTYPLASAPGVNTSGTVTSSIKTTTARATSVAHGFSNGNTVTIAGATPVAFNGTFTIAVTDANNFTYTLATAEGNAAGTITASAAGAFSAERSTLIKWVRGEDNFEDENLNGSTTDIRASVHGDVLHSSPAVVNYNRYASDNDVFVFYGSNDGIFRAVKGGYVTDNAATALGQPAPGNEAWGFIPQEFFGNLNRLRTNSPKISSAFPKPYFADGPIGIMTKDTNGNGKLGDAGDVVNLYIAMRRGGRLLYALDANDPMVPKFKWKIDNNTAGFSELGQTWSQPTPVANLANYPSAGSPTPVVVFGAGYDAPVEDIDPTTVTAASATSVTTASGTVNRTMGRGIYVVNADTGALVWSAGPVGSGATTEVPGMDFAIPSGITIGSNPVGALSRAYVGDTGGNLWRIDFKYNGTDWSQTTVTKIASIADLTTAAGRRKFFYAPEITRNSGYFSILIGSGNRERPFDNTVADRFYMFKDYGSDTAALTGTTGAAGAQPYIVESTMFDASSNCLQDQTAAACGAEAPAAAQTRLNNATGWYVTMNSGEKVIGNAVAAGGTVVFGTNQPSASAGGGACGNNLGISRIYQIAITDATSVFDFNVSGGLTGADRSQVVAATGFLAPPSLQVPVFDPQTGGAPPPGSPPGSLVVTPPVGTDCSFLYGCANNGAPVSVSGTPYTDVDANGYFVILSGPYPIKVPGSAANARLRKFWAKEIE